ncbi:hypothetical protein D3C72_2135300 [compost metagenome]
MEPLSTPESAEACAIDGSAPAGVTGLNCAGFGSSVVVTACFGMVAAAHALKSLRQDKLAEVPVSIPDAA